VRQIDPDSLFHRLFDLIPGVYFFAKNRQGQLMFLSRNNSEHARFAGKTDPIGLTDFDLNPVSMAASFARDDRKIYATGKPILNRVELWVDELGVPNWFVVNKMPIYSKAGRIVGIMGFSRACDTHDGFPESDVRLSKALNHIRMHHGQDMSIRELARISGLSTRQLERRFRSSLGLGPQQFLIKTRLLAGCRKLLETRCSISEIAYACGFADQSAFTRHFRMRMGLTPTEFRARQSSNVSVR
jgi:AraC-like DNA-binding protein